MFVPPPPPPIGRHIGMPPQQDVPTPQGSVAIATDDAAAVVVRGHHSPVVVLPAVTGHGKLRRRKYELDDDAAGSAGLVVASALSSRIDASAADVAVGSATDRARHHRRQRMPASERTRTEAGFSKYDDGGGALTTARPVDVLVGSRRKHRAAAGTYSTAGGGDSYYASDDYFATSSLPHSKPAKPQAAHYSASPASAAAVANGVPAPRASTDGLDRYNFPSVKARPNGLVSGGKHRNRQAANHAAASISSSRLVMIREPTVAPLPPHHHRPPKPHKDHEAPSSSVPAPLVPEPNEDDLLRVGLEVASKMDVTTLRLMAKEYVIGRNHEEAEAAEEERPPFWRPLTDDEVDADLTAIYDMVAAQKAAASGNEKRHRH